MANTGGVQAPGAARGGGGRGGGVPKPQQAPGRPQKPPYMEEDFFGRGPSQRMQAGVGHLGGPKGEPRYYNKASGKMETVRQMNTYKASQGRGGTPPGGHPAKTPSPRAQAEGAKSVYEMNPQEQMNWARGQSAGVTREQLANANIRRLQLGGEEQNAMNRYQGGLNNVTTNLGNIANQANVGAKTAENHAAENLIKFQNEIETTGQNAQTANGGFMDPQLKAQMENEQRNVTGIGINAVNNASERAASENQFMRQLQAATQQAGVEGRTALQNTFARPRATLAAEEQKVKAGEGPRAEKLFEGIAGKTIAARANEAKLGAAYAGIQQRENANQRSTNQRETGNIRTTQGANYRAGLGAQTRENVNIRTTNAATTRAYLTYNLGQAKLKSSNEYHNAQLAEKERLDNASIKQKEASAYSLINKASKGSITPSQVQKTTNEFGPGARLIEVGFKAGLTPQQALQMIQLGGKGKNSFEKFEGKTYKVGGPKLAQVKDPAVARALVELWFGKGSLEYGGAKRGAAHGIGPRTRAELGAKGLNIGYDNEAWSSIYAGR